MNFTKRLLAACVFGWALSNPAIAQPDRWQQRAEYVMQIEMNEVAHQFKGKQTLTYYNNSPDSLDRLFYHLYFNAFQPNSMMDVRSRTIQDPDGRVGDRIQQLKPDEIGYQKILSLTCNGNPVAYKVAETILEVQLPQAIKAGEKAILEMEFESQVPLQIRRCGRDNAEGVEFSMSQWYPKLCEYDYQGWHANPYVAREFYGVWGDFDVTISMNKKYIVAATGILQNPQACAHGYEKPELPLELPEGDRLTWHFVAKNVHDFVWAADPDYTHTTFQVPNEELLLRFFYQKSNLTQAWEKLPEYTAKAFQFASQHYGKYPYAEYSVIQGGDGGMEYPMATLITGHRKLNSLVGVTVHELMHTWYQMLLATNESLYAWMDEGFTSHASDVIMAQLFTDSRKPHEGSYNGYFALTQGGSEEPLTTHADHFQTNEAYGLAAYAKGAVFLEQLSYIIGREHLDTALLKYFDAWAFKHPNANDFIRIMEKQSGLELDWYKEYWVNTTHTIDYGIVEVKSAPDSQTEVILQRVGAMPMPLDILVEYTNGESELFYIPLDIMRGEKPNENNNIRRATAADWYWTHPTYNLLVPTKKKKIARITLDPSLRMADTSRQNNIYNSEP